MSHATHVKHNTLSYWASTAMSNTALPLLSVEVLHRVFDSLNAQTILHSVPSVCTKLYASVKTYNRFKFDLPSYSIYDFRPVACFVRPENVISLSLFDNDQSGPCSVNLLLSFFSS